MVYSISSVLLNGGAHSDQGDENSVPIAAQNRLTTIDTNGHSELCQNKTVSLSRLKAIDRQPFWHIARYHRRTHEIRTAPIGSHRQRNSVLSALFHKMILPTVVLFGALIISSHAVTASVSGTVAASVSTTINTKKPQRIVSTNLCTDQLLLMLVAKERIASLTKLARLPEYSYMWEKAQSIPTNSGLAEEIIPLRPDLILTTEFSPGKATSILQNAKLHVEILELPDSFAGVEILISKLGKLVGEAETAAALITSMRRDIESVEDHISNLHLAERPKALIYSPNGHTAGSNTFKNTIVTTAGYDNIATELGIVYYSNLSVEQVLLSQPELVIVSDSGYNNDSLAHRYTDHPALLKWQGNNGMLAIPDNQWLCVGPMSTKALQTIAGTHK
jgi:iron complex transport system substrate-binding protein